MSELALTWADLFCNGSLIDLDVKVWDGLVRLKAEDLGIPDTEEVKTALTFGHERLVPKGSLQEIRDKAYQARSEVDRFSIPFKLVPGSRYLPLSSRKELVEKLEVFKNQFLAAVNKFLEDYETNSAKQQEVLLKALTDASKNEAVAERALARLRGLYPTNQELHEKFDLLWRTYSIAAPQDGTADGTEGNAIKEEIESMIDKLRERLTEKVKSILELVSRGGKITAKTYNSATKMCDRIMSLNMFGDAGLIAAVAAIREAVSAASNQEDGAGETLKNGLEHVEEELIRSREEAIAKAAERLAGRAERRMEA